MFSAVLFWGILGNAVVLVKSFSSPARHIRRFDRQVRKHTSSSWDNQRRSNQNFRIATTTQLQSSAALSPVSWVYLSMLAFQFGCQPLLTKAFTPSKIVRSTVILAQDLVRFLVCCTVLLCSGTWTQSMQQWTLQSALHGAGIPSALYLVQNYCALMAYQNLPPVTFNVLNQTKTLSAAFFCYIVMGRPQSRLQIVSLLILLLSALVIEKVVPIPHLKGRQAQEIDKPEQQTPDLDKTDQRNQLTMGVLPVLIASGISGLGES